MKSNRNYRLALILVAIGLAASATAGPLPLTINFAITPQSGSPGQTLTFGGTIANTGDAGLFINQAGISLIGFGENDYNYVDYFLALAPLTLDANSSFGPFDFFTVTIPVPFASGSYLGTLLVQGGTTSADDQDLIGTGDFAVDVNGAGPTEAPEPATLLLVGVALAGILARRRR